ncbi:GNAT family N-acetyltransferase [uncultured Nostoc sp.]|uniref:GNAT family N-acetyltransferase n=1 Tax=uncultured Nostoc sp. TaxID=340711 RepID=UPI0035C9B3A5
MSSSGEPPVESYHPPSGYSLRRGTLQDIQSYNFNSSFWIIAIAFLWLVISIRSLLEAWLNKLSIIHKAYLFEYGKLPENIFFEDLQYILPSLKEVNWSFILVMGSGIITAFLIVVTLKHLIPRLLASQSPNRTVWVAEYQQQIVGWAILLQRSNYTILSTFFITSQHRSRGVGSYLLWSCLKNIGQPVYLICLPQLQSFYARFGFVALLKEQVPKELRFSKISCMGLLGKPIPITNQPSTNVLPSGILIRPFQNFEEQFNFYTTFWHRKQFRNSRLYVFSLIAFVSSSAFILLGVTFGSLRAIFGLTWLANFDFYFLGIQFLGITIAAWLYLELMILMWFSARWQEWIIEQDGRAIGYIHFSQQAECSILYNLYVEPQEQLDNFSKLLLARLSRQIALPLYFNCPRQNRQFYTGLGFTPVNRNKLPFELKILQLTNQIPLKLTHQGAINLITQLPQFIELINSNYRISSTIPQKPQVKKIYNIKKVLIQVVADLLIAFMIAPAFQLPQMYAELKHQTQIENPSNKQVGKILVGQEHIRVLAIAYDNQTLISGNENETITICNLSNQSLEKTISLPSGSGKIQSLAVSPDKETLVIGTSKGIIQVWNYKNGTIKAILSPGHLGNIIALKISSDGQKLVIGSWNDAVVKVWDLRLGQLQDTLNTGANNVLSLAISQDSQTIYIGLFGTIQIWHLERQLFVDKLAAHSREIEAIAVSTDGKLLVSGGTGRLISQSEMSSNIWMVKVWDAQTLKLLKTLQGDSSSIYKLILSPDAKTVIFDSCCKAHFWDWINNKDITDIHGLVRNTVLSPNSKTIVSVASDGKTMTITDLETLRML